MKLAVVLTVLGLVASSQALKCYTCKSSKPIDGLKLGAAQTAITSAPLCSEFDASEPDDKKFLKDCPKGSDKACMKMTDPKDSSNELRGCFMMKKDECKDNSCYCAEDACNGSGRGWPSAVLLTAAALAAALVGGH